MLRCVTLAAALAVLPAAAQAPRNFPASALRGELVIVQPPAVQLNGRAARLAPGARIRGQTNLLEMSGALVGRRLIVNYTRDLTGQILDVWLLTAAELGNRPWPTSDAEAQAWSFDAAAQRWTKP
jgi:hypothetical protein